MNHYHVDKSTGFDNTHPIDRLYLVFMDRDEVKVHKFKAKKTENWANMPPSLLAAVFLCLSHSPSPQTSAEQSWACHSHCIRISNHGRAIVAT